MSFIKLIQKQGTNKLNVKAFVELFGQGRGNFIANLEDDLKILEEVYKRDSDEIKYIILQINQGKELTNSQWANLYNRLLKYLR